MQRRDFLFPACLCVFFSLTSFAGFEDSATLQAKFPAFSFAFFRQIEQGVDGKITLSGSIFDASFKQTAVLARFNDDGKPDKSFGKDGVFEWLSRPGEREFPLKFVLTPDGKTLIGEIFSSSDSDIFFRRLDKNGEPDKTFGKDGKVSIEAGFGSDETLTDFFLQADGSILFFGNVKTGENLDPVLGRLTKDGELDSKFGTGGITNLDLGKGLNFSPGIRAVSKGRFLVGMNRGSIQKPDYYLARIESDGSLDETFGDKGFCQLEKFPSPLEQLNAFRLDSKGRILVGGTLKDASDTDLVLVRYLEDCSLDTSFAEKGIFQKDILFGGIDRLLFVGEDSKGRLLVMGTTASQAFGEAELIVFRLQEDGSIDDTFGNDGYVLNTPVIGRTNFFIPGFIQADDKFLIPTMLGDFTNSKLFLTRMRVDGSVGAP